MTLQSDPILEGGGECGALMRALDWANNALGLPSAWPAELRTLVSVALSSTQPMLIVWGPQQTTLYNDGYAAMCGVRHPDALGNSFQELWYDIWDQVDPIITAAYNGIGTSMDDIAFTMHRNGRPEETHFAFSYTPVRNGGGEVLGMFCACVETTSTVILRRQHETERDRMLQVFEMSLGGIALLEGAQHVFTYANAEYLALIGHRDVAGKALSEALPEVVSQGFIDLLDGVFQKGEPYVGRGVSMELQTAPDGSPQTRMLDFFYNPMFDKAGQVTGIFVQALDVTDRVAADQHQQLLNRELGHRMKNQLALVQAIVNQTFRSADDLKSAGKSLNDRVAVLANAHDILINGGIGRTTVGNIVHRIVALHDDADNFRFRIDGPDLTIASRPALSLSLMLHELSTNAAKYGALTAEGGYVSISWRIDTSEDGPEFQFEWIEKNGPAVSEPSRKGSGSRLIGAGLSGTVRCTVSVDYAPDGVQCRIVADLKSMQTEN